MSVLFINNSFVFTSVQDIYIYIYTYIHTYIHTHARTHTHTHIHRCGPWANHYELLCGPLVGWSWPPCFSPLFSRIFPHSTPQISPPKRSHKQYIVSNIQTVHIKYWSVIQHACWHVKMECNTCWAGFSLDKSINIVAVYALETCSGSGGTAPFILPTGTRWRWVVILTHRQVYPRGKKSWHPLTGWSDGCKWDRRLYSKLLNFYWYTHIDRFIYNFRKYIIQDIKILSSLLT